jgi:eukaryotic-like serine/threonine-protein kinase
MVELLTQLGPYKIESSIGKGAMGHVFLALDTATNRPVALKVVRCGSDSEQQAVVEAERLGATLQQQFSAVSSFVPQVYQFGIESDSAGRQYFFVAMEYFDGGNLSALIAAGVTPERAIVIASELCRFVEEAAQFPSMVEGKQGNSLVHGDLKPHNVRVTSTGTIKVLDFGIAKALSRSRKVTRNDFGSLHYLSPERLDTGEVDQHSDFWALGVMLYEMVGGALPFDAPDTHRLEKRILERRPPTTLDSRCPRGLQAIIFKLLAPSVDERYATAQSIREDLERAAAGVTTAAEREGWPAIERSAAATHKTRAGAAVADEPTRRTIPPQPSAGLPPPPPPGAAVRPPARRPRLKAARWAFVLLTFWLVLNEFRVANAAHRLAVTVASRELDSLGDAWDDYESLTERSRLGFATLPLRQSLTSQTAMLADRVIADYRTPNPSVRERQWTLAREALAHAVATRPDDQLQALMRYCDGQLFRINGEAALQRRDPPRAQRDFMSAIVAFREAAELRSDWPDPFLGLARTFIYAEADIERAADALKQAERLGYKAGPRETALLADGYRARGDALATNARELRGMAQESPVLTQSADAYQRALTLYMEVIAFGDAPQNVKSAQRGLDLVQRRRSELSQSPAEVVATGAHP